jgi:hypothetical protein
MELFFGWVLFALLVGAVGSNRKIGFTGSFILSLILSPIIGLIITLFSKTKIQILLEQNARATLREKIDSQQPTTEPQHQFVEKATKKELNLKHRALNSKQSLLIKVILWIFAIAIVALIIKVGLKNKNELSKKETQPEIIQKEKAQNFKSQTTDNICIAALKANLNIRAKVIGRKEENGRSIVILENSENPANTYGLYISENKVFWRIERAKGINRGRWRTAKDEEQIFFEVKKLNNGTEKVVITVLYSDGSSTTENFLFKGKNQ